VQLSDKQMDGAQSHFESAARLDPASLAAQHWLAVVAHDKKQDAAADLRVSQILKRDPEFRAALADRVRFAKDREDWPAAAAAQAKLIDATKNPAAIEFCRLGEFRLRTQDAVNAEKAFLIGIQADPYSYSCNRNLAELYRQTGSMERAHSRLDFIVRLFPDADPTLYTSLSSVLTALGDHDGANAAIEKGRRLFPEYEGLRQAALRAPGRR
jgi:tetratricopeptide (TPR) repeat protein